MSACAAGQLLMAMLQVKPSVTVLHIERQAWQRCRQRDQHGSAAGRSTIVAVL